MKVTEVIIFDQEQSVDHEPSHEHKHSPVYGSHIDWLFYQQGCLVLVMLFELHYM